MKKMLYHCRAGLAVLALTCFIIAPIHTPVHAADTPPLPEELKTAFPDKMILLDFHSPYCGACRMMEPHLKSMKKHLKDDITFIRLDISLESSNHFIERYKVSGVPTYILFNRSGKPIYKMSETISPSILRRQLERYAGHLETTSYPKDIQALQQAAQKDRMVLVAFQDPDACLDCQEIQPYLNALELTRDDQVTIVRLNTQEKPVKKFMKSLGVNTPSTYILFDKEQKEIYRLDGNLPKSLFWKTMLILTNPGV